MINSEDAIREILLEESNRLPLKKYIKRELETMSIASSFQGYEIKETNKTILAIISALNKWNTDAIIATIARLKDSGFFA